MRLVIQRALNACVTVDNTIKGSIEKGFVILVGITSSDTIDDVKYLANKTNGLRVFTDEQGKMNRSIHEIDGQVLSISQFTLYADTHHGNRPSFIEAARPEYALNLYEEFNQELKSLGLKVETGVFGADMKVSFTNDGPVTIIIDSKHK